MPTSAPPRGSAGESGLLAGRRGADDVLLTRFDAAALVPVLQGRQLLLVHVERASDILQTLALKGIPEPALVLVGATEGWTVAQQIAAAGVPVIANALGRSAGELRAARATQSNVGRMRAAGINVAIGMINDEEARRCGSRPNMPATSSASAGCRADRAELGRRRSRRSPRRRPRRSGSAARSARCGPAGAPTSWSGTATRSSSPRVDAVWIDGVRQPLTNRQTELRDRYRQPQEGALPHAYDPR